MTIRSAKPLKRFLYRCSGRPSGRPSNGLKPVAYRQEKNALAERTAAALVVFLTCLGFAPTASAGENYAVLITGASGGEAYAQKYDRWRAAFVTMLREKLGYQDDRILVLADTADGAVQKATRDSVQRLLGDLRRRLTKDDQLFVLLIGHGTSLDGDEAKFNLVGPDLSATEWSDLLKPIPGRLVFVNTTGASFPFLQKLAGRGRIVLTATDSAAQQFETVFPEYFIKAFDDAAADGDKNGRVSMWEAFAYASAAVHQWFEQKGQLPTERPLLDDTGGGVGREAQNPGTDGAIARATYLNPDVKPAATGDTTLAGLIKRRSELDAELEQLRARKATMAPEQYAAELERLLTEISRVAQQIRTKS
jgi:hypothetical protein